MYCITTLCEQVVSFCVRTLLYIFDILSLQIALRFLNELRICLRWRCQFILVFNHERLSLFDTDFESKVTMAERLGWSSAVQLNNYYTGLVLCDVSFWKHDYMLVYGNIFFSWKKESCLPFLISWHYVCIVFMRVKRRYQNSQIIHSPLCLFASWCSYS